MTEDKKNCPYCNKVYTNLPLHIMAQHPEKAKDLKGDEGNSTEFKNSEFQNSEFKKQEQPRRKKDPYQEIMDQLNAQMAILFQGMFMKMMAQNPDPRLFIELAKAINNKGSDGVTQAEFERWKAEQLAQQSAIDKAYSEGIEAGREEEMSEEPEDEMSKIVKDIFKNQIHKKMSEVTLTPDQGTSNPNPVQDYVVTSNPSPPPAPPTPSSDAVQEITE